MRVEWSSDSIFLEGIAPTWGVQVVEREDHFEAYFLRRTKGSPVHRRKLPKCFFGKDEASLPALQAELQRIGMTEL